MAKVSASVLAADYLTLKDDLAILKNADLDMLHMDVMDGLFVPNISFGAPIIDCVAKYTDIPLDVHLMIDRPHRYVEDFCKAGADLVVFHVEAAQPQDIQTAIDLVKAQGKKVGLSVKPRTPAAVLAPYIEQLDLVLVMTVEPGFGGQSFMHDQLGKIAELREMIDARNPACELEVDGGVDPVTAPLCKNAGANVLVAGSAVFNKADRGEAIRLIRES